MAREDAEPLKVLLVDDDPVARHLAALLLQRLGCAPAATATDGRQAIEAALQHPYDLVLMDLEMPELDGRQAIRAIVDALGAQRPRIIAMTASDSGRADCIAAGADEVLPKPLALQALSAALARVQPGAATEDFNAAAWEELRRVFKPGVAAELVRVALLDLPEQRRRHAVAVAAGDLAALGRLLHALRGACLQLGATALAELCVRGERACAANDRAPALHAGAEVLGRYAGLLARLVREAGVG